MENEYQSSSGGNCVLIGSVADSYAMKYQRSSQVVTLNNKLQSTS
jgi:hypothetical protein